MADDRMYIRCKGCGKTIMFAKTFSSGYYVRRRTDELDAFFDRHAFCNSANQDICKFQDFELRYESEDDFIPDDDD